ncbi:MAG TPA: cytochrome P450 [Burkholderiaceae bacterium]|nr:cytochrome P450 [Burkholderiaceae bacterium]
MDSLTATVDAVVPRNLADLPGPRGWPIVGNALQIDRDRLHQQVEEWSREFGPVFRFRLGRRTLLAVADHEAVATALRDRPDGFRRTRRLEEIGTEIGLTPGVFGANGEAWKRQRRMVMAGFDPGHVKAYFPALLKVAQRLRGRWQRAAAAGEAIELQPELMRFTVDAIAGLAFGADVNTLESDDEVIQQHLDKIFPALYERVFTFVPWWRWFPRAADRQLEASVIAVDHAIAGFIAAARERLAADPARRGQPPNLLEAMIVSADAGESGLTDRDVAGNVLTMLLAGEDTTANTLAWMIELLVRHPHTLQRAQAEVRALGLDAAEFTPEALASLDYLEACAHETMRLKPVAPFQVIEALRETIVAGVRVPAGTGVWCVMRADSVSEKHFPQPLEFRPERWLGDADAAGTASAKRVSMPFGAGPRVCPGRYLALLEMRLAMATLLNHFDIVAVDTPNGGEAAERMAFTMTPVGLRMRLAPRA